MVMQQLSAGSVWRSATSSPKSQSRPSQGAHCTGSCDEAIRSAQINPRARAATSTRVPEYHTAPSKQRVARGIRCDSTITDEMSFTKTATRKPCASQDPHRGRRYATAVREAATGARSLAPIVKLDSSHKCSEFTSRC